MTTKERLAKLEELKGRVEADATVSQATREYAAAILEFVGTWVTEIELMEARLVPPLSNGLPRVLWDESEQPPLTVLVTEKGGVTLMATLVWAAAEIRVANPDWPDLFSSLRAIVMELVAVGMAPQVT